MNSNIRAALAASIKAKSKLALWICACILACAALAAARPALAADDRAYPILRGGKYDFYTRDGKRLTFENYTNAYAIFPKNTQDVDARILERNQQDEKERMEKAGYIVASVEYDKNHKYAHDGYYIENRYTDKRGTPITEGFDYFLDFPFGVVGVRSLSDAEQSEYTLFSYEGTPLLEKMDMITPTALPGVCVATSDAGVEIYRYRPSVELVARIQGALDTSTNEMSAAFWVAKDDGKLALYSAETGKQLTEYAYEEGYSAQGVYLAKKADKTGALNEKGEEILPFQHEVVYPYYGSATVSRLYVRDGDACGMYDVDTREWVVPMGAGDVSQLGGFYLSQDAEKKKWTVLGENGPMLEGRTFDAFGGISYEDEAGKYHADAYLGLWDGDDFVAIDEQGKTVDIPAYTTFILPKAYIVGKPEGTTPGMYSFFGLMGKDGEWILPQEYVGLYYMAPDVDPGYLNGYSEKLGYFAYDVEGNPYRRAFSLSAPMYDLKAVTRGFYTGLCDADGNWVVKLTNYEALMD